MKEMIARWAKQIEELVAFDRGCRRFKDALNWGEYVHVFGHDSSMLEMVLDCGAGVYEYNRYTRIVWSAEYPKETPFAYSHYIYEPARDEKTGEYVDDPRKPKQAFHDDVSADASVPELLSAEEVERRLGLRRPE